VQNPESRIVSRLRSSALRKSDLSRRRYIRLLRKHSMGMAAALLCSISLILAWLVARVNDSHMKEPQFTLAVSVLDPEFLRDSPVLHIDGTGRKLESTLDIPAKPQSSIKILYSGVYAQACSIDDLYQPPFNEYKLDIKSEPQNQLVNIRLGDKVSENYRGEAWISLHCRLAVRPFDETFADRKFQVSYAVLETEASRGIVVDFSRMEGISDLHLASNIADSPLIHEGQKLLNPSGGKVNAEWKDTRMLELRDILLVLTGALLGLAASCLLEWVRPYITPVSSN
jgi:hypothetical protein